MEVKVKKVRVCNFQLFSKQSEKKDYAVVGAYRDDHSFNNAGSVYVFKKTGSTWSEVQKLIDNVDYTQVLDYL